MTKNSIVENLKKQIEKFNADVKAEKVGRVVEVFDGIARVSGLSDLKASEMVSFASGATGVALNLDEDSVGVIILGGFSEIKEGEEVRATGEILSVPVGDAQIGRVVNALGVAIDGKGKIATKQTNPIERVASGVMSRQSVDQPVQTGIKAIDAIIPVGRGQRELIIGDRQTGKTAIAIDARISVEAFRVAVQMAHKLRHAVGYARLHPLSNQVCYVQEALIKPELPHVAAEPFHHPAAQQIVQHLQTRQTNSLSHSTHRKMSSDALR